MILFRLAPHCAEKECGDVKKITDPLSKSPSLRLPCKVNSKFRVMQIILENWFDRCKLLTFFISIPVFLIFLITFETGMPAAAAVMDLHRQDTECPQAGKKTANIMTINETQDEIIEEFEGLADWMDRYAYIIDLGVGFRRPNSPDRSNDRTSSFTRRRLPRRSRRAYRPFARRVRGS